MLLFGIGLLAGLLINPFRNETKNIISAFKQKAIPSKVSFIEPTKEINSNTSLKEYLHE